MMTAQVEYLKDILEELKPLFPTHWDELALNKDKVPLKPDYAKYLMLEELGIMHTVVLRKDGHAIGYIVGLIQPHLHYMTCLTYIMDILYVKPEERGVEGGKAIMDALFKDLKYRGVQRAVFNEKLHHPIAKLFLAYKMTHIENIYSIWLGEK